MPETTNSLRFIDTPARPPVDPELLPVLDAVNESLPRLSADTLPVWRQSSAPSADLTAAGTVRVEERQVPGPDGAPDITLLILSPEERTGPLPAIYHVHGSGMVSGDRYFGVEMVLPYVSNGHAIVVSVEYRLAPEHPDPALVDDSYAGLVWTTNNAGELGIEPERIMIYGLSAGGGVAAGTALLARDRAFPELSHQILICPMLDDRFQTHSSRMLDGEGSWDRNSNLFAWTSLLGDRRGKSDVSAYAAPARAEDLVGLPRTYIEVGSAEGFRDEAAIYALRLSEAGVSVDLHMWGGGFHGFDLLAPDTALSRAAISTRDEFIRRALGD